MAETGSKGKVKLRFYKVSQRIIQWTTVLIAAAAANGIETVRLKVRKELLIRTFNKKSFSGFQWLPVAAMT